MPEIRYSIVITCYNQEAFIEDAIDSVLSQPSASKEVIVVDDASRDSSLELIKTYGNSVHLIALPTNVGVTEARNRGAAFAQGEYLIFLDGDDLFTPWTLEAYDQLLANRQPAVISSGALWFKGPVPTVDYAPTTLEFVEYESLTSKDRISGMYIGAFVIKRLVFLEVGGWTPGMWHLDGQDLYAKLAYSGTAILVLSPYTMFYRMHRGNSIHSVEAYIQAAHLMMDREQAGVYPGGPAKRSERYARLGGVILFCSKRLLQAGFYRGTFTVTVRGSIMILAAILHRLVAVFKRRRPVQTSDLHMHDSRWSTAVTQNVHQDARSLQIDS